MIDKALCGRVRGRLGLGGTGDWGLDCLIQPRPSLYPSLRPSLRPSVRFGWMDGVLRCASLPWLLIRWRRFCRFLSFPSSSSIVHSITQTQYPLQYPLLVRILLVVLQPRPDLGTNSQWSSHLRLGLGPSAFGPSFPPQPTGPDSPLSRRRPQRRPQLPSLPLPSSGRRSSLSSGQHLRRTAD